MNTCYVYIIKESHILCAYNQNFFSSVCDATSNTLSLRDSSHLPNNVYTEFCLELYHHNWEGQYFKLLHSGFLIMRSC